MLWIIQSQKYTFSQYEPKMPAFFAPPRLKDATSRNRRTATYGSSPAGSSPVGTAGLDPMTLPPSILPQ